MALEPGSVAGPFRIVGQLGQGGMASVYRAHESALDRDVALKVLPREFLHDPGFVRRFEQEAKAIARLEHPNIVPIYAYAIDKEEGIPWMAMRLVGGGSLKDLLRRGRPPFERSVAILREVASALDYAHAKGVVHRDVKPPNVLLDEAGRVYLADFGIAKMLESQAGLTATGMITGTPQYMAPEQATGLRVDHHADIYALGIMAYEMFTGHVPFAADTPVGILMKHVQEPLPLPPQGAVPEPLMRAVLRCTAKKPEERWATAGGFAAALEAGLAERAVAAGGPPTRAQPSEGHPTLDGRAPTVRPAATVEAPARRAGPAAAAGAPPPTLRTPSPPAAAAVPPPSLSTTRRGAVLPPVPAPAGETRAVSGPLALGLGLGGLAVLAAAGLTAYLMLRRPAGEPVPSPATAADSRIDDSGARSRSSAAPSSAGPAARAETGEAAPAAAGGTRAGPPRPSPSAAASPGPAPASTRVLGTTRTPVITTPTPAEVAPAPLPTPTATPVAVAPAAPTPDPQIAALVSSLGQADSAARWRAAQSLGALRAGAAPAVGALVNALSDRSPDVRWRSAEALGLVGPAAREAVPALARAVSDPDPLVQTEAMKALGLLGAASVEAVPALAPRLEASDVSIRREAARALGRIGPGALPAMRTLVAALRDKDKFVRMEAARALGRIGPSAREAAPALATAARDAELLVAREAQAALKSIGN